MTDDVRELPLYRKKPFWYALDALGMIFMLVMGAGALILAGIGVYNLGIHIGLWDNVLRSSVLRAGTAALSALGAGTVGVLLLVSVVRMILDWILKPSVLDGTVKAKKASSGSKNVRRWVTIDDRVFSVYRDAYESIDAGMRIRVTMSRINKNFRRIERLP